MTAGGIITWVNDSWLKFAQANGAPLLLPKNVVGTSIWEHIEDHATRHLYRTLLKRLVEAGREVTFPFRCDAPAIRRFMHMRIVPVDNDLLEFKSWIVREEAREPVMISGKAAAKASQAVKMCSWCKRIATPDWIEIEEAIVRLRIFDTANPPGVTHTACPDCREMLLRKARTL